MTKKQIDELNQRVDAIDGPKPSPRPSPFQPRRYKTTMAEPPTLTPLTEAETAFLKARGIDPDQREIILGVQMRSISDQDKQTINSLKNKRTVKVTYYQ